MMKLFFEMLPMGGTTAIVMAAIAVASTVWGVVLWFRPSRMGFRIGQLACSLLPAFLGLWKFYRWFLSYRVIAYSQTPLKVEETHFIFRSLVVYGIVSLLSTVVPASIGILGLLKRASSTQSPPVSR